MIVPTTIFSLASTCLIFLSNIQSIASAENPSSDDTHRNNKNDTTTGGTFQEEVQTIEQPKQPCNIKLNKITGNIFSLQHDDLTTLRMSLMNSKILVNYGQYIAFPKEDGSFEVDNVPSDSYVVEVTHPKYIYEPARVDITTRGRIRARRVNYFQPALVQTIDYPLIFRPKSLHNYFLPRETWRIMDLIFNPMVMMMVVPLIIIWLLPKMMNPQEAQTQRDTVQMPEYNVPELSEMMASMFGNQGQSNNGNQANPSGNQAITSGSTGGSGGSRHSKGRRR